MGMAQMRFAQFLDKVKKRMTQKPNKVEMKRDIQLMGVKIRPIDGVVNKKMQKDSFVEALWTIGVIDQMVHEEVRTLPSAETEEFIKLLEIYMGSLHGVYKGMNDQEAQKKNPSSHVVMVEVFRDGEKKVN